MGGCLGLELVGDVPRDGLTFAVEVGREIDGVGAVRRRVDPEAARVRVEVEHAAVADEPADELPVVALVREEAGLLALAEADARLARVQAELANAEAEEKWSERRVSYMQVRAPFSSPRPRATCANRMQIREEGFSR